MMAVTAEEVDYMRARREGAAGAVHNIFGIRIVGEENYALASTLPLSLLIHEDLGGKN